MEKANIILPTRTKAEPSITLSESRQPAPKQSRDDTHTITSLNTPQDVLQQLKSQPGLEELQNCLEYLEELHDDPVSNVTFHVRLLGPLASQVVFVLVNDIVPSYWSLLSTDQSLRKQFRSLVRCLKSVAGIGATTTRLKALCNPSEDSKTAGKSTSEGEHLKLTLQLLECLLQGDKTVETIWRDVKELESNEIRRPMVMDQVTSFLAGGSVLSAAAQAAQKLRMSDRDLIDLPWVGDGKLYASWLGRNILHWSRSLQETVDTEGVKSRNRLANRSFSLGYTNDFASPLFKELVEGKAGELRLCRSILSGLTPGSQITAFNVVIGLLASRSALQPSEAYISGAAALIDSLLVENNNLERFIVKWLAGQSRSGLDYGLLIYRAAVAALSKRPDLLKQAHSQCLKNFGSRLNIKQDPILQQERQAQVFLLLTGSLLRTDPPYIKEMKHSSDYLNTTSNRLAAPSTRAQFLGMAVGMAVSDLVDEGDNKLKFTNEDINGEEGQQLRSLIVVHDKKGAVSDLAKLREPTATSSQPSKPTPSKAKSLPNKSLKPQSKIVAIEEIDSDSSSEDDLPTYGKPDSDASDSEDDPTLIDRDKPTAPVYIRDLLSGLRDTEKHDRHQLAITTAPGLIRRKSRFGTEVTEHAEELATALIGLKDDTFDTDSDPGGRERFARLRLQAMIALIVSGEGGPERMAPWFAHTFFNGDYSISQRASILTALALAARELAGYGDEDADLTAAGDAPKFASKRLPSAVEGLYLSSTDSPLISASSSASSPSTTKKSKPSLLTPSPSTQTPTPTPTPTPVTHLSSRLERSILHPLAASAAASSSTTSSSNPSPTALKIRNISTRIDPATQSARAARSRIIPNTLAKQVSTSFFYPLTSRWRAVTRARRGTSSSGPNNSALATPFLVSQFVRTLALILAAAGRGTLSLDGMTAEFWALILGMSRGGGVGGGGEGEDSELRVVEALLFGQLTLLDLNSDRARSVVEGFGEELEQTRTWAGSVLERVRGSGGSGGLGGLGVQGGRGGASGGGATGGATGEEDKVRALAAAVLVKSDEIVDAYRRELMGGLGGGELGNNVLGL